MHSSDHIQTSEGFVIYVPDIVRDVTIELTHYPQVEQNNPLYYTATKQADVPINLPIIEDNGTGAE
ncbi:hypothetical protein, partial [Corynebacterium sp. LK2510]|uniref:hypothetical protein n=1 Tax=Corynebacterium sp. LK2510 TaxID=3110472 RepID=UPI0034CFCC8A